MTFVYLAIRTRIAVTATQQVLPSTSGLKSVAGDEAVIHGLRHSFRDRLRAAEAPSELIDQLGGWSLQSVDSLMGTDMR